MIPGAPPPPPGEPGTPWETGTPWEPGSRREPAPSAADPLHADPDLRQLREARRRPVFAVTGGVVGLYLFNALLASEVRGVMSVQIAGPLNIGLGLALLQCVTTVWAARWYARHARTVLDPDGRRLRAHAKQRRNAR